MPLRFLTAGESHGPSLTAILDGMPAGLLVTPEIIRPMDPDEVPPLPTTWMPSPPM